MKKFLILCLFLSMSISNAMEEPQCGKIDAETETICLAKPIHTILFSSTSPLNRKRTGIFITVFGEDNVGEVVSPDYPGNVLKHNVKWSSEYEKSKGKPIEFKNIKIDNKYYSGKIEIVKGQEHEGVIKVTKKEVNFMPSAKKKK